ncbi:SPOR domain-containing protein [Frigidibacter sp. RF13]|uniref:SPOR domain-containing protein n=1 Tax=Frigidibacter sp. RF13 TaxID=2997340 RepID=UPI00226DE84F|nr:SPOR domain-containing protein [Frigidibacter sp. RF13]MCY1126152.1 SPOR domain-containing protein [Frigidibacter sp. RF13]
MRVLPVLVSFAVLAGQPSFGQVGGPAEPPPADYAGRDYTDSKGCLFQRAVVNGAVLWAPRLDQSNKPVCGEVPTAAPVAEVAADAAPAPEPAPKAVAPAATKARRARPALVIVGTEAVASGDGLCPRGGARAWLSDGRRITRCGGGALDPASVNALGVPGLAVAGVSDDPAALARAKAQGAGGYRLVWSSDGTLEERPVGGAALWVQVGAFADPANTEAAATAVKGADLPVARQKVRGGALTAVLAGPFATEAAAAAARARLKAGFPGAFIRP